MRANAQRRPHGSRQNDAVGGRLWEIQNSRFKTAPETPYDGISPETYENNEARNPQTTI